MTLDDLGERLFASTNEVAAIIGSDPRTVRRMIADGSIPARKNGSRHIVAVAWLREFTSTSAAPAPAAPDIDALAERVADRLMARLGYALAVFATADMAAAGAWPAPAAIAADSLPVKELSRDQRTASR